MFPGQGAKGVADAIEVARTRDGGDALLGLASGVDPADLVSGRATHLLDRTDVLQPVLVAIAVLVARDLAPSLVLGHSLGELSAFAATGGLDPEGAVRVARARGEAMADAARQHPGGMLAIATDDASTIDLALAAGRAAGEVDVAAYNAWDETVLTGDAPALQAAARAAERAGARAARLPVAGPWHAPRMVAAAPAFAAALSRYAPVSSSGQSARFITNRDGSIAPPARIPALLVEQLGRPVAWRRCVDRAIDEGATELVVVPPAATTRALIVKHLDHRARTASSRAPVRVRAADAEVRA